MGGAAHRYAHPRAARLLMDAVPKAAGEPSDPKAKRKTHLLLFAGGRERGDGEKKNGGHLGALASSRRICEKHSMRLMRLMRKGLKKT